MVLGLTETDGLAIAMLVTLLSSFGVIGLLVFFMIRNAGRRDGNVDQLLEDLEDEEGKEPTKAGMQRGEPREEWERDEDWWKKEE